MGVSEAPASTPRAPILTEALQRPFRAIIFDWDGTAVRDRSEDARPLAAVVEPLLRHRVWIIVVTGTNFGNIDRQFCGLVRPTLRRHHLVVCCNRGSEVYGFDARGKLLQRWLRTATLGEERALTAIAESVRDEINARSGLEIGIVYDRLNRRKIDLIPLPEWADPPKAIIGELLAAVESRLGAAGLAGGIGAVIDLTLRYARAHGLPDARITSDVKHVEIGLTDKGDSMAWIKREVLDGEGIVWDQALIVGDEFGPIAGFAGSDDLLMQGANGATVVSVGREPNGAPPGVLNLGGGPRRFRELLAEQGRMQQSERAPAKGR